MKRAWQNYIVQSGNQSYASLAERTSMIVDYMQAGMDYASAVRAARRRRYSAHKRSINPSSDVQASESE
jgi:hypothetical protein